MKTSQNGLELIKNYEGFSSKPYLCPAGVWTIGYGSTYLQDGKPVTKNTSPVTESEALQLLSSSLEKFEHIVNAAVHVAINQNQFDALVSLCYNIGGGNFSKSTLVKLLNNGNSTMAAEQFTNWNKVNGQPVQGLTNRRIKEKLLFLSSVS